MNQQSIGIDLVDVARFGPFADERNHPFLKMAFTGQELEYCFSLAIPAEHLAGMFAAKEAAIKALGVDKYPFIELEIKHSETSAPEVWHKGKKLPVSVSISHTASVAGAVALAHAPE